MRINKYIPAFTLLELLITIVIIAILAVIAVPAYSNYRIRGKVAAMVSAASAAELQVVSDYFNQENTFSGINYSAGSQVFLVPTANFISSIAISNGVITVTGNSADLGGRSINLVFTPSVTNNQVIWTCSTSSSFYQYAPVQCQ